VCVRERASDWCYQFSQSRGKGLVRTFLNATPFENEKHYRNESEGAEPGGGAS